LINAYPQKNGIHRRLFTPKLTEAELRSDTQAFIKCFWEWENRDVFVTGDGSVALCPTNTQPDDVIVILYSGYIPFILRPKDGNNTADFDFIGSCYYGARWMKGDTLKHREQNDILNKMFTLV
jgi:hypothetical protein